MIKKLLFFSLTTYLVYGPGGVFMTRYNYAKSIRQLPDCGTPTCEGGGRLVLESKYCKCALEMLETRNVIRRDIRSRAQRAVMWFSESVDTTTSVSTWVHKYTKTLECDPTKNGTCALHVCDVINNRARKMNWKVEVAAYMCCLLAVVQWLIIEL